MDTMNLIDERTSRASKVLDWQTKNDPLFQDGHSSLDINRHRFKRIFKIIPDAKSKSVSDIGSFPGFGMTYFENYSAIGKIGSEYAQALNKLHVPYQEIDIEEQGFSSNAELVLFQEVIEHLRRPKRSLVNIYDSMAPGSLLYLTTNNIFYYGYIIKLLLKKPILDDIRTEGQFYPGHCRYYSVREMQSVLQSIGFEVIRAKNINLLPPIKYYRNKLHGAMKNLLSTLLPNGYATHIELVARKPLI